MIRALSSSEYSMVEKNIQIECSYYWKMYFVKLLSPWYMIISPRPMYNKPPINFSRKICPPWKTYFRWEGDTSGITSRQDIAITFDFYREVSFKQHNEFQVSLSLWVQFSEPVAKIWFLSNLQSWNPLNYLAHILTKICLYCISPQTSRPNITLIFL